MKICHNLSLSKELIMTSLKLLLKRNIIDGKNIELFEEEFRRYHGMKHAIATSSGRYALYLILKALDIRNGKDEILLPVYMPWIVAKVAMFCRLKPVFVDVDPETFNINPQEIEKKITKDTKILLVVHLYGVPCDMDAIVRIAQQHHLILIEDCAQALGATYKEKKVGTFGDISFFSFGKYKNPTTYGGGMIITNDDHLEKKIRSAVDTLPSPSKLEISKRVVFSSLTWVFNTSPMVSCISYPVLSFLRLFNEETLFQHSFISCQSPVDIAKCDEALLQKRYGVKYTNLQATIGLMQLKNLDEDLNKRMSNAETLNRHLKKTYDRSAVSPSYLFYCLKTERQQEVAASLFKAGIVPSCGHYLILPDVDGFNTSRCECPQARALHHNLLYLPVHSRLRQEDMMKIVAVLQSIDGTVT